MAQRTIKTIDELKSLEKQDIGTSDWLEITLDRIRQFADATSDHQWIHLDAERCAAESPFGAPIAHGYLTLSLMPYLIYDIYELEQPFKMTVNYGINKLRFMSPVKVGQQIRARLKLLSLNEVKGGYQANYKVTVEIKDQKNAALIGELVYRYLE